MYYKRYELQWRLTLFFTASIIAGAFGGVGSDEPREYDIVNARPAARFRNCKDGWGSRVWWLEVSHLFALSQWYTDLVPDGFLS